MSSELGQTHKRTVSQHARNKIVSDQPPSGDTKPSAINSRPKEDEEEHATSSRVAEVLADGQTSSSKVIIMVFYSGSSAQAAQLIKSRLHPERVCVFLKTLAAIKNKVSRHDFLPMRAVEGGRRALSVEERFESEAAAPTSEALGTRTRDPHRRLILKNDTDEQR